MLHIKSITSCNINGLPLFSSDLSKRIHEYKKYISENLNENYNITDNELCIVCIQGLYAYRCGLLGYLSNLCSYKLSQNNNPSYFQRCINYFTNCDVKSNDYEIFSYGLSLISRTIPFINILNWDFKSQLFENNKILKYSKNYSMPSIFNLTSIYLLKPIFDSGCAIYSNRKETENGFELWNVLENCDLLQYKMFNSGITWSFYESDNKKSGIMIFNINILRETPEWVTILQLKQIIELKERLDLKFAKTINYEVYDTFILGNFSILFNLRNVLEEVNNMYKIFEINNFKLINEYEKSSLITDTNFIFHNRYTNKDNDNLLNVKIKSQQYMIQDDIIHNIDFEAEIVKECKKENIKLEITVENLEKSENKITIYEDYEPFKITVDSETYREFNVVIDNEKEDTYNNAIYRDISSENDIKKINITPRSSEDEWQEI